VPTNRPERAIHGRDEADVISSVGQLRRPRRGAAQFLWEARVTALLDHPNIVPVHDLGLTPEGELFMTMKLVCGATLEAVIVEAREAGADGLNLTRRLRMFLQLCNAVSFARARGVLHRDLKPANVMVGEFGEVLVTDWGARAALRPP
jgi:serine/threonine-protein kinase